MHEVKAVYRSYFAKCQKFIKMNQVCNETGVIYANFARFMQGSKNDKYLSVAKCQEIKNFLETWLIDLVA